MHLYSWGANSHGQLGQGMVSEACCTPTKVEACSFDPQSIKCITGGGGHTLLLEQSGNVYGAGWNCRGQLGIDGGNISTFRLVESLHGYRVSQLACGWDSSLAVNLDGTVAVWGSNSYSQLGISKEKFVWTKDPQIISVQRVKQAALGLRHLALVTLDGRVLVSGTGSKGQLGIIDSGGFPSAELKTLTSVPELNNVSTVACGQHHTVALTQSGQVYVWGDNRFGQLGLDPSSQAAVHAPQEAVPSNMGLTGQVVSVFCGWTHTVLLTDKGEIVNWGRNTYGQLGTDSSKRLNSWSPSLLTYPKRITQISVGSEHNVALINKSEVLCWGWNEHGNCGVGSQDNVYKPGKVILPEKANISLIGSGACHSFAVM